MPGRGCPSVAQQATDQTSIYIWGQARTYAASHRFGSVEPPILWGGLSLPNGPVTVLPGGLPQSCAARLRGELRAVPRAGLAQHGSGMLFDCLDGQHQLLGNELVRQALFHQAPDLLLPLGQHRPWPVVPQTAVQLPQYGARQDRLAASGRDDRPGEFRAVRADVNAPARPGTHGACDQPFVADLAQSYDGEALTVPEQQVGGALAV